MVLKVCQNHLEGMLKHRVLDSSPRVSDSLSAGQDSRICIFHKVLGAAAAAGPETTL